jgi:hypothetical protein
MSRTPFSRPDVDDLVSGSHVFKKRFSLNNRLRARLPKARVKHLFGIVIVVLFLFGSQLTACGYSTVSPTGSGSPTSNTTSIPNTPGSRSGPGSTSASTSTAGPTTHPTVIPTTNPTAGPTTHPTAVPTTNPTVEPTTDPTAVPTASPSSFVVTEAGITYAFIGTVGQSDAQIDTGKSDFGSPYIDVTYGNPNSSTPAGPIDWSATPSTTTGGNWLDLDPRGGSLKYGSPLRVNIKVSVLQGMQAGTYNGMIVFSPNTSGSNHDDVTLTVVPVYVSSISPTSGPSAGGTSVTVRGSGFTGASSVSFGATLASNIMVNSDTKITATSPAGSGTVDVTVTTPNGTSATGGADQFTYILIPTVVPSPTPTNTPTPTPTTVPSPTPTDTPTPMPPTPTPIPSNTPTPTSIPSMTAHNRFLFRY